ncbi:hypothetical protein ACPV6D_05365 [Corynebacterium propinquum]|uniref:hypothetical protein n=1 Tax=Corynebacterium propinquum TaxID=43769 RepID=UPI003C9C9027
MRQGEQPLEETDKRKDRKMTTYTTHDEAVQREIIEPLGEFADEYDIDAIADEVIVEVGEGVDYGFTIDEGADFWAIVEKYAL